MRGKNKLLLLAALCGVLASSLRAQDPGDEVIIIDGEEYLVAREDGEGMPMPEGGGGPPQGGAAGVDTDTLRLQRLLQLQFDRKPSSVLGLWAGFSAASMAKAALPPGALTPEEQAAEAMPPGQPAPPPDPFAAEVAVLQSSVTLGDWANVTSYIAHLAPKIAPKVHKHLLAGLAQGADPNLVEQRVPGAILAELNVLTPADVVALGDAAPGVLDPMTLTLLGKLLRAALAQGHDIAPVLSTWDRGTRTLGGAEITSRTAVAHVLFAAGRVEDALVFAPLPAAAAEKKDHRALDLLGRLHMARFQTEKKAADLERAWEATRALIEVEGLPDEARLIGMDRALELVPRLKAELGQAWLVEGFTRDVDRARRLLAGVGRLVALNRARHRRAPDERKKGLELQRTPVDSLLESAPARAAEWHRILDVLAKNWLHEAQLTLVLDPGAGGPMQPQWDEYGNMFFARAQRHQQHDGNVPVPVVAEELLEVRPTPPWLERLDPSLLRHVLSVMAELHLKAKQDDQAFELIERLAPLDGKRARDLAHRFLSSWINEHDLNRERRRNPWIYFYGFEERADAIPLTRSKQQRNLEELGALVARLRALPIEPIDEALIADAFVKSHGAAEVYRMSAIETVFGPPGRSTAKTLATLVQIMRGNLASVWRDPKVQEQQKTKRREADIQVEVRRGYEVARALAQDGLAAHPDEWQLLLANACLTFDHNEYERRDLQRDPAYAAERREALDGFAAAAAAYTKLVPTLSESDEKAEPFELWFHAALGAPDLKLVSHEHRPDFAEVGKVRAAIEALPAAAAERHTRRFARSLFQHLSAVRPEVKFNFLRAGFAVVGDHEDAREAKDVFSFYEDLVKEITLVTALDGSDRVGHQQPFGLFVHLRHTKEIERESGGFGKYLQNQNQSRFSWNYGRPTEDYREKFEEGVRATLQERFEVLSITFNVPEVTSRADPEVGWRLTPYAYVLLEPKGPEVDTVPALEMSMDFLDTSGYVILPIASAPIPIDAKAPLGEPRPLAAVEVSQTLDERRSGEGLLVLEVKASGRGIVPTLEQVLDLQLEGFQRQGAPDDPGVSAVELADDEQGIAIKTERSWLVKLEGKQGQAKLPSTFTFPPCKLPGAKVSYGRYDDADVSAAAATIDLRERYGTRSRADLWVGLGAIAGLSLLLWYVVRLRRRVAPVAAARWRVPERVTPFTVIDLLQRMQREGAVHFDHRGALADAIHEIERRYFAPGAETTGDGELVAIARTWVARGR